MEWHQWWHACRGAQTCLLTLRVATCMSRSDAFSWSTKLWLSSLVLLLLFLSWVEVICPDCCSCATDFKVGTATATVAVVGAGACPSPWPGVWLPVRALMCWDSCDVWPQTSSDGDG